MTNPTTAKLSVNRLRKDFQNRDGEDITILNDISLEIASGEFVCIVGASGCGKTTFIRVVGGLTPASGGEVRVDGRVVTGPAPDRAYVFQHDSLFPWRTVLENVVFGLEVQGIDRAAAETAAREKIEIVGLGGYEKYYPHELSGGMRQRVNLARALAVDPEVLLMDEPFAALDAQTREIMQRELLNIWEKRRKTVIFITHQIDEAVYLSDRVLVFGTKPGCLREDIPIGFPRQRSLALKRDPKFLGTVDHIWSLIEKEVVSAAAKAAG